MQKIKTVPKIFASLAISASALWIGSYLARLFVAYQLFEGKDLVLRNFINENNINGILTSLLPLIATHFITFIVMILFTILFYSTSKVSLRFNGWLFIILIAIIITLPFEIYLMLIDYKIISVLNSGTFNANYVVQLLRDRINDLSSFPIVEIFTYISFYFFIVFQPLTKNPELKV